MEPNTPQNEGYVDIATPSERPRVTIDQALVRKPTACPYQAPCWKFIRAPLARKGYIGDDGKHYKVYMPYICSYQQEGDIESCGRYQTFVENEERDKVDVGNLPTTGVGADNI